MDYYDYYHETHDENRTDEEPASESQDDGFVNIEERELKGDSGIWDFSVVDAIEFEGKIFVLTGFGAQEEEKITQEIQKRGGTVKNSTVVKTDYLIVMEDYIQNMTVICDYQIKGGHINDSKNQRTGC